MIDEVIVCTVLLVAWLFMIVFTLIILFSVDEGE